MVKVHFNEKIETVETYDAVDYDRTSVPIAELNDAEYNEIECYRLEMKKQTIEEYQKRWKKRNSTSSDSPVSDLSNNSSSDSENISPTLKSCLVRRDSNPSNKLNVSAINAAISVAMSSSLEDDANYFHVGQPQPNILLNTPHSSDYNSDECPKVDLELSSSVESNNGVISNPNDLRLFSNTEKGLVEEKEDQPNHDIISPLPSINGDDTPASDNDADVEESEGDNSFIRLNEDSYEDKNVEEEEEESDYIKDISLTEGENSISLNHHMLSDDIPTTSFHSQNHHLFTDSLFNTSPILAVAMVEKKNSKNSQSEDKSESIHEEEKEKEENEIINSLNEIQLFDEPELEDDEEEVLAKENENNEDEKDNSNNDDQENNNSDVDDDNVIDSHPHSDTFVNYGGTQHINIKPRRQYINNLYDGMSSNPVGKPMSFLDDLPETFQTPLSSSLPSKSYSPRSSSSNFFGSPFTTPTKSPYGTSPSSYLNRSSRFGSSSNYTTGNNNNNDGSYLVSKRNYLSISGNRDSKPKSYPSYSQNRLSHYTTSKWEGLGGRSKSNSNSTSNNSSSNKYYPRSATKLVSNSPFSSSWIYDASF